ncbi:MAG TPA: hypothetical protein VGF60_08545 [Xanthobacteraceae bacterium]|jgi:hypothetical protein
MPEAHAEIWPWLALAGIGLFHGINPAMGWLFAVALGLHRNSQRAVLLSLVPIALGHAAAVAAVLAAVLALGLIVDRPTLSALAAAVLIGWALWHALYGHRQRLRVGMQAGAAGLLLWSFLMASAHGAGLMLIPVLSPICAFGAPGAVASGTVTALLALGLHTATMLAAIAIISIVVYKWVGTGFLRRGWINLDFVWIGALLTCGIALLVNLA